MTSLLPAAVTRRPFVHWKLGTFLALLPLSLSPVRRCNIIQHLAITHEMLKPYIGQERFHDLYGRQVQKTAAALALDASAALQDPLDMELL